MYSDLENQIKETVESYCETKNLDQEIKEFILQMVKSSARAAASRDVCNIALRMYNEGVDIYNIRNFTGGREEDLLEK
jgi:hypothetical protein